MRLTFKTEKETGLRAVCYKPSTQIKIDGKQIGYIFSDFKIRLMIYKDKNHIDDNPNCGWLWIKLKHKSENLNDAKRFVRDRIKDLYLKFKIRQED